jgi:hypothetical protein
VGGSIAMLYDTFMFFDELDILEIRLNILDKFVDRYVLVEATRTHSGQPKKLVFHKNRERFAKFLPKIEHIIVEDMPLVADDRWVAENFQRDAIMRGLGEGLDDDWVVVSDVDEIWNPAVVREFPMIGPASIAVACRGGCLNSVVRQYRPGPVVARLREVREIRPQGLRDRFEEFAVIPKDIEKGGWHFSWIRRSEMEVNKKLAAFAHKEFDNELFPITALCPEVGAPHRTSFVLSMPDPTSLSPLKGRHPWLPLVGNPRV